MSHRDNSLKSSIIELAPNIYGVIPLISAWSQAFFEKKFYHLYFLWINAQTPAAKALHGIAATIGHSVTCSSSIVSLQNVLLPGNIVCKMPRACSKGRVD
ncbi:Precorrin-3B methylase [Pseudomonas syringae pv. actinidiae]|uniref:Precorrin-3B methylase n=1 Tax=Pseudomonas syringae pv. actinidiae TaxID=103796 RepID=A0A2V0QL91_PSESF|nr:Precorrin-3B methylase [Pseudomonas syringae pv. actinidiae]